MRLATVSLTSFPRWLMNMSNSCAEIKSADEFILVTMNMEVDMLATAHVLPLCRCLQCHGSLDSITRVRGICQPPWKRCQGNSSQSHFSWEIHRNWKLYTQVHSTSYIPILCSYIHYFSYLYKVEMMSKRAKLELRWALIIYVFYRVRPSQLHMEWEVGIYSENSRVQQLNNRRKQSPMFQTGRTLFLKETKASFGIGLQLAQVNVWKGGNSEGNSILSSKPQQHCRISNLNIYFICRIFDKL